MFITWHTYKQNQMWVIFLDQLKTYVCCRLVKRTDTTSMTTKKQSSSCLCSSEHLVYSFQLRFSVVNLNRNDVHTGCLLLQDLLNKKLITYISKNSRHAWKLINLIYVKETLSQLLPSIIDKSIPRKKKNERWN